MFQFPLTSVFLDNDRFIFKVIYIMCTMNLEVMAQLHSEKKGVFVFPTLYWLTFVNTLISLDDISSNFLLVLMLT